MRGYVICTGPRSGSNFLCDVLASTGVLGRPAEYFHRWSMQVSGFKDYPEEPEAQFEAITRLGATPNGVYGLKIFSYQFEQVTPQTRWASRLPALAFISLVRLDTLRQAISRLRASQTQQWRSYEVAEREPVYDFNGIRKEMAEVLNAQSLWAEYFARNGLPVLQLFYEWVADSPQQAAEAVARFIGLDEHPTVDLSKVRFEVQRDALSEEWRDRFIAEARDLDRLE